MKDLIWIKIKYTFLGQISIGLACVGGFVVKQNNIAGIICLILRISLPLFFLVYALMKE
jgi:hypothetical protein